MVLTARLGDGLEMRRHNRADKIGCVTRLGVRRFGPRHNRLVIGSRPTGPTVKYVPCFAMPLGDRDFNPPVKITRFPGVLMIVAESVAK